MYTGQQATAVIAKIYNLYYSYNLDSTLKIDNNNMRWYMGRPGDTTQFPYQCVHLYNTCKGVFNSNVTTFQLNCVEGLHFSAFHYSSKNVQKEKKMYETISANKIT